MDLAIDIIRWIHVALGIVGLIVYWIPIFATKGGKLHVRFGRYFVWCAYGVAATALVICVVRLVDPPEAVPRAVHAFLGISKKLVKVRKTRKKLRKIEKALKKPFQG